MAAITKTRKLEKRPKTKKFPFSRPGTKLYPTNSKRVYSRTVTLFSTCKVRPVFVSIFLEIPRPRPIKDFPY